MRELDEFAAEPIKYFSHDSNAHHDRKCKRLKRMYGFEGYGRWWQLCELLASADGHYLPSYTEEDWELIADDLEFETAEEAKEFIHALQSLQLLEPDDSFVYSHRMFENAIKVSASRRGGKKGAIGRWGAKPTETPTDT
jgi:hypothetical protein